MKELKGDEVCRDKKHELLYLDITFRKLSCGEIYRDLYRSQQLCTSSL